MLENATATAWKYYCGGKGSNGLNDGRRRRRRRRRRRKKAVPRAAAGYARQLKIADSAQFDSDVPTPVILYLDSVFTF